MSTPSITNADDVRLVEMMITVPVIEALVAGHVPEDQSLDFQRLVEETLKPGGLHA